MAEADSPIIDRPRPGRGYLVFMSILAAGALVLLALVAWSARDEPGREQLGATVLFFIPLVVLLSIPFHAAFNTRYEIAEDALRLRSGFVIKAALPYGDITEVESISFIHRVLGWGSGRGIANRFSNGLQLRSRSGKTYLISPTDPDAFAAEIARRRSPVRHR